MVTKPTGRPRARPRVPLRSDPDRYAVAMALSFEIDLGLSARKAALLVAAVVAGREGDVEPEFAARHPSTEAMAPATFYKVARPGAPATIEGKAATIRQKMRGVRIKAGDFGPFDIEDGRWLHYMATAFLVTRQQGHPMNLRAAALHMASLVGERAFAEAVLLPMIDARFLHPSSEPES
jgi:hypothetical protein